MKESDEAREQEDFWENKKRYNKGLIDRINVAMKEEFGKDPLEGNDKALKKSLRNQFNY
jgi:dynein intermediate chain 1